MKYTPLRTHLIAAALLFSLLACGGDTGPAPGPSTMSPTGGNGNPPGNMSPTGTPDPGTTAPPAACGLDAFKVTELYASKSMGEAWTMDMQNPQGDPRVGKISMTKNADGSFKVQSDQIRWGIYTTSGYHPSSIGTLNQGQMTTKGYMQSPNDWKNIEMTAYVKVNQYHAGSNGGPHLEWYSRSGTHGSPTCEGTALHSNTYPTKRVKFEKELEHTAGYTTGDPENGGAGDTLQGHFIGIKAVFYNTADGSVKLEQWLDTGTDNVATPGNKWHKVLEYTDSGSWGGGSPNCGGTPSTKMTWGGPITAFRWDNINDLDIKWATVREIAPGQTCGP